MSSRLLNLLLLATPAITLVPTRWNGRLYGCKCYTGDSCWPTHQQWSSLNASVDGNLLVDVPPGSVCHNTFLGPLGAINTYNATECADVLATFYDEQWTTDQPAAELWTYYTNETCRPTTEPSDSCTLGFYGVYVILAELHDHVKAGIDFARTHNLRLIVRNTGHDFLGRSTGWGSLIINTHSFKDATFIESYNGPGGYQGPAVKVGAGVQGAELLKLAHAQNPPLTVVVGECATVGPAGGFIQGGGHGPLTTVKGLAADNALDFQVLTAAGEYVIANAKINPDLFWALRGGGPAAYAVILSVTFRTFVDVPSAGAILNINSTHTTNETVFWEAVRIFHSYANNFVDNGLYVYFEISASTLHIQPFVAVNQTAEELDVILQPLSRQLDTIGLLNYKANATSYPTLYDLYIDLFEGEVAGYSALTGGWMFAHEDVDQNNQDIVAAFRNVIDNQGYLIGHMWDPGYGVPASAGATNPRFRNASDFVIIGLPVATNASLEEKAAAQELVTYDLDQAFRDAGPNGCGYINEGDPYQPDWQINFYGINYQELLAVRKRWDPNGVFYAIATPGTEAWEVIQDGTKLCKKTNGTIET